MDEAAAQKRAMRESMRAALRALGPQLSNAMHAAIHAGVVRHPAVAAARTVLLYAPVPAWHEFETAALAGHLLAMGKRLSLPLAGSLDPRAAWITDWTVDVVAGASLIREPRKVLPEADPTELDVVIVPGLAFDLHGRRLGRGGGYYDRLLPRLRPQAVKIGVAWEVQIVDEVPTDAHDQRMDVVVTERRTISVDTGGADRGRPGRGSPSP